MLKVGLVGVGGISHSHIDAWEKMDDANLIAMCDIRPERMEKFEDKHRYTDFDEMLANEEFDIIDICLPTYLHADFAIKAMEKGINVITEKHISLKEEDITEELIEETITELIPKTFDGLLSFANEYDAPEAVEGVFKWDVADIFYNYFFAGNYMNVGGPCSDNPEEVDIYNLDVIKAMQIYQSLNQFFSFEANDMKYASVIEEFMAGKMVYTTATSDIIKTLDAAKEEGTFTFDYGLVEIPNLNEELQSKNLSVTNTVVVNGFSDGKEDANKFASYLTSRLLILYMKKQARFRHLPKRPVRMSVRRYFSRNMKIRFRLQR